MPVQGTQRLQALGPHRTSKNAHEPPPSRRERPDERLLDGVLGRREVRTATDEDTQDLRDELAQLDAPF